MNARPLLALGCVTVVIGACVAKGDSAPTFTARDSAGVRIVEYADEPAGSRSLSVSTTPLYRIGDDPGEREFGNVPFGRLRADGGALVVDVLGSQGSEVLSVGSDGSVRSIARSGQGPTEVRLVTSIQVLGGDTALVHDGMNGKILVFGGDSLVRTIPTPNMGATPVVLGPAGFEAPGTVLMGPALWRPIPQEGWIQGRLGRMDLATGSLDSVGVFDLMRPPVQPPAPTTAFGPNGAWAGSGAVFVTGRTDIPQLTWRGPDGRIRQLVRWKSTLTYPTEQDLETYFDQMQASMSRSPEMPSARIDEFMKQQRARIHLDASQPLPLYSRLLGDGRGGVWIGAYAIGQTTTGPSRWSVLSPAGESLGSVALPDRFRLLDVRGNRMLGILSDSLDVQSVAVFELTEKATAR